MLEPSSLWSSEAALDAHEVNARLFIIGAGISWRDDLTFRGWRLLHNCRKVFFFGELPGFAEYLARARIVAEELSRFAVFGEPRLASYGEVAHYILDAAEETAPVGWVTLGNPAFCCGVSSELRRLARERKVQYCQCVAPSSLDAVLDTLPIEVSREGIQVVDASRLVEHGIVLNPAAHSLVIQLSHAETRLHAFGARLKPLALMRLRDRLEAFYPPEHSVLIIARPRSPEELPVMLQVPLSELPLQATLITSWASLFIPALTMAAEPSAAILYSQSRLEELVETPLEVLLRSLSEAAE